MGAFEVPTEALIRYGIPDQSASAEERSLLGPPGYSEVDERRVELHDARTDENILSGATGLDFQGFTYVHHKSALSENCRWLEGDLIEKVYVPECEALVRNVTGAARTVANYVYFRRRKVTDQSDPKFVYLKGNEIEKRLDAMPKDKNLSKSTCSECMTIIDAYSLPAKFSVEMMRAHLLSQHEWHTLTTPQKVYERLLNMDGLRLQLRPRQH